MTACQPALWHDLFVALAGPAAALAGLISVAVSINLEQILKYRGPALAGRFQRADRSTMLRFHQVSGRVRRVGTRVPMPVGRLSAEQQGRASRSVTEEASVTSDWFQAGAL